MGSGKENIHYVSYDLTPGTKGAVTVLAGFCLCDGGPAILVVLGDSFSVVRSTSLAHLHGSGQGSGVGEVDNGLSVNIGRLLGFVLVLIF